MEKTRILIVEDDESLVAYLESLLAEMGYQVSGWEVAGQAAILAAQAQQPDLILMDIHLRGEMSGIQAAQEIHRAVKIPIVFLTGFADELLVERANFSTAYACLTKPVRERELRVSLEMALYRHTAAQRLEHLDQVLRSIREVNRLITRERDPRLLFEKACEILVRTRGYRLVWIGQMQGEYSQPMTVAGQGQEFLDLIIATASSEEAANLPCAMSMKLKQPVICPDLLADDRYRPWHLEAQKAGFFSSAAIPMLHSDAQLGVVCVFADRRERFDAEETSLLLEVAGDLALALKSIQAEAEHRQAEEKLCENEQRFHALIEKAADLIVVIDALGLVQFASPPAEKMLGYLPDEVLGRSFLEWIHPDDLLLAHELLQSRSQIAGTAPESLTLRVRHKNGEWRTIEGLGTNLLADPAVQGIVLNVRDITEQKNIEQALRESEERYRSLFEDNPASLWEEDFSEVKRLLDSLKAQGVTDLASYLVLHPEVVIDCAARVKILDVNKASLELLKAEKKADLITDLSKLFDANGLRIFANELVCIAAGQTKFGWEGVNRTLSGEKISIHASLAIVPGYESSYAKVIVTIVDVTGRKAAEAEIKRHLSELEVLYENGLTISRLLEPHQIGQKLIEILSEKLEWHHAAIRVIQPETGGFELLGFGLAGLNTVEAESQIKHLNQVVTDSGKGLSGWVTEHGQPVRCAQVQEDQRYLETYPGIQSGLYVPIRVGERTIGSIAVESEKENAFSEQDERLLVTIASQAAISIRNAQLYSRAQKELAARELAEKALLEAQADLERRVVERTAEVQDLYDNAACGYHSLDADGKFVHMNKTELDWLGYEWEEVIGHPVFDFMSEKSRVDFSALFPVFKKNGVLNNTEFEFVRKGGSILTMLSNSTAIYAETGAYKLSRSTLLDISKRKQIELALRESEIRLRQNRDELSAANHELEKAARLKDEFLASMSHELRTPLTGILGLSEALQLSTYGELSQKQREALANIESSGRHLLELINDILDLSKIEAGKFEVQIDTCSLAEICQASLQLTKGLAEQKHQMVSFSIQPPAILVRADARRLKQMLVNLLSNAVKFTPDGGELGLEVCADESEERVRLTVWDQGIGIQAKDLSKLFKSFVQLDSSLSRQHSGTGLGLALVLKMAELQGGSVEVESAPGTGSRFTIILPWSEREMESSDARSGFHGSQPEGLLLAGEPSGAVRQLPLILLADDNENTLEMLSTFLETRHYRVISTRSGSELLKRAPELHPDLMLVDIQMPGMDGLETIRRLRAHPEAPLAKTPVIAITALAMPGDRERCLSVGANAYLSKPLKLVQLISLLEEILHPAEG